MANVFNKWGWFGLPKRVRSEALIMIRQVSLKEVKDMRRHLQLPRFEGYPVIWWKGADREHYWPLPTRGVEIVKLGEKRAFRITR